MLLQLKTIFNNFYLFLKNPKESFTETLSLKQKWEILFSILVLDFLLVFFASGILSFIDSTILKLESDKIDDLFANKGAFSIILIATILVPLIEELIFRLPLNYKRNILFHFFDYISNKKAKIFWFKHFNIFFYLFAFSFALVHLTNYNNTSILFYLLAPLIVLPQFIGGVTLGYLRLRLGFFWGVLQHGLYNLIVFSVTILFFKTNIVTKINNTDYSLEINTLELGLNKPENLKIYKSDNNIDSIIGTNTTVKDLTDILNSKDTVLLKTSKRLNIRYINKTSNRNPNSIIINELKKEFY